MVTRISTNSPFEESFGYSRAIVDGDMIRVSGTTGYDYVKMDMPDDVGVQTANALDTIAGMLKAAGSSLNDVVRVRYYIADASYQEAVGKVVGSRFHEAKPAATMIVCGLIRPEMKIEIEVTARRGASSD